MGRLHGLRDAPGPEAAPEGPGEAVRERGQGAAVQGQVREPEGRGRGSRLRRQFLQDGRPAVHPRAAAAQHGHHDWQVPGEGRAHEPEDGPAVHARGSHAGADDQGVQPRVPDHRHGRVHQEARRRARHAQLCVRPRGGAAQAALLAAAVPPAGARHLQAPRHGPRRRPDFQRVQEGAPEVQHDAHRPGDRAGDAALRPRQERAGQLQRLLRRRARRGLHDGHAGEEGRHGHERPEQRLRCAGAAEDVGAQRDRGGAARGAPAGRVAVLEARVLD
mmetsp:Transcript_101717/g.276513  ORF Transcript_101717/g.276513 Transcript_101717/m.276513 type:complete len:275 (-) Transcript_101717:558-1382(-)